MFHLKMFNEKRKSFTVNKFHTSAADDFLMLNNTWHKSTTMCVHYSKFSYTQHGAKVLPTKT